jgi:hypothetical protein
MGLLWGEYPLVATFKSYIKMHDCRKEDGIIIHM